MRQILSLFGLEYISTLEISFYGSPERSVSRTVVRCSTGDYIVEKVSNVSHKLEILDVISSVNVPVPKYLGIKLYEGSYYQVSSYVYSDDLDQATYSLDFEKGVNVAKMLNSLIDLPIIGSNASLDSVAHKLIAKYPFLSAYYYDFSSCPLKFAHGDLHPRNILWSGDSIKCVIDWEFFGKRYEDYDLANFIGCVGIEDPNNLTRGLVEGLIKNVNCNLSLLPEKVLFSRFAWLVEWVNKKDSSMISMEFSYMEVLYNNLDRLRSIWTQFQQ